MRLFFLNLVLLSSTLATAAEPAAEYNQPKIPLKAVIWEIPTTTWETLKYSFSKDSIPAWATIISTTLITYHYDDDLYDGARNTGHKWNIGTEDHTKTVIKGGGFDLLRLPSDTGSFLYFLGDGWIHMGIAAGFFTTGYITDNNRPYNTGLQMVHGMVTATIFSQSLKRATGRESPNKSTAPRGRWRPFPSLKAYQAHTATYDAFPSGHIMTAALVFTVINTNYPEYFWYTMPTEVIWLTALGFEMANNGVHWVSDYPLGIGIGYAVGKMATRMTMKSTDSASGKTASHWVFFPSPGPDGPEMNALYHF